MPPKLTLHTECRGVRQVVMRVLDRLPGELAALVRTTAAVVDVKVSPPGHNVVPDKAIATVNYRVLPGACLCSLLSI